MNRQKEFYKEDGTRYLREDYAKQLFSPPKKRMQFSQKVCVFGLVLIAVTLAANFALIWSGRPHMSDLSIVIVTVFGGFATGGYFALSGARDLSRNKHADKLNRFNVENNGGDNIQ